MDKPKVFIIGETSSLAYLNFIISQLSWDITTYDINDMFFLNIWSIPINGGAIYFNILQSTNNIERLNDSYQIMGICDKVYCRSLRKINNLKSIIYHDSILIDCCHNPFLFDNFTIILNQSTVLDIRSVVEVRKLTLNPQHFKIIVPENLKLIIRRFSRKIVKYTVYLGLNFQSQGFVFKTIQEHLEPNKNNLILLIFQTCKFINKLLWKNLLIIIFQTILVMFGYEILKLTRLCYWLLMKRNFNEILTNLTVLNLNILLKENSKESTKLFQNFKIIEPLPIDIAQHRIKNFNPTGNQTKLLPNSGSSFKRLPINYKVVCNPIVMMAHGRGFNDNASDDDCAGSIPIDPSLKARYQEESYVTTFEPIRSVDLPRPSSQASSLMQHTNQSQVIVPPQAHNYQDRPQYYQSPNSPPPLPYPQPLPFRKNKSFHHLQLIDKSSSPKILRQYHADLMESVKFDTSMEQQVSNRYGKYDTSSFLLNSANNSRSSKESKDSKDSKANIIKKQV